MHRYKALRQAGQASRSSSVLATTFVARRRSSRTRCSSARFALLCNTVRGPAMRLQKAEASLIYGRSHDRDQPPLVQLTMGQFDLPFGFFGDLGGAM